MNPLASALESRIATRAPTMAVRLDFHALWLDARRVYSCAYWPAGVQDLASAQEAKLDLVCRKLMLRSGERFLDVGAGWGALLLWAAEHYGVQATGITLSKHQHAHVQRLIDECGLAGRVRTLLLDYCALPEDEPFDKIDGPMRGAQSAYPFSRDHIYSQRTPCSTSSSPKPPATSSCSAPTATR